MTQFSDTEQQKTFLLFKTILGFFNLGNTFIFFKEEVMQRVLPKQEIVA